MERQADDEAQVRAGRLRSATRQTAKKNDGAPELQVGEMVDNFRVERLIGMGGMGAVYVAQDTKLGRDVALKVVQAEVLGSHDAVERFIYEAQTTAKLNHPHIVTIYAVGEHAGQPYVALELVEGSSLDEQLDDALPPLREAVSIALTITEAVAVAHEHGVLHRDLKPANIVLPPDGRLRVLDFGLAKRMVDVEGPRSQAFDGKVEPKVTYAGAGTPAYMAPEQWLGETSSRGTDVWAIGMILFELCTGRLPYEEDLSFDLAQEVCGAEPAPRLDDSADVPVALADVVARCLEKLPDDRPSAQEVTEELRAVLEQLDQAASTTSPRPHAGEERPERDPSLGDTEIAPARVDAVETTSPETQGLRAAGRWLWALPLLISVVVLWLGRDAWLSIAPPVTTASPAVSVARGPSVAPTASVVTPTASVVTPTPTALPSVSSVSSVAPRAPAAKLTGAPRSRENKALAKSAGLASAKPATLPPFRQKMAHDQMQNRARAARRNCKLPGAPGQISVSLRFMPSGNVGSVRTSPLSRAHAHPAVNCVAGHFGGISVPPFSGGVRAMTTSVSLR